MTVPDDGKGTATATRAEPLADHGLVLSRASELPDQRTWQTMLEMAKEFVASGLLPSHVKTPQAAVVIMQKAREIGVPPLYGLSNIAVISGKPTCNSELMLALVYRDHGDHAIVIEKSNDTECAIAYRRRSWRTGRSYAFTIEAAQRAGLLSNTTWQKYPAAMLRARCISAVARMAFPDSIAGMYTPEELGADVTVTPEGDVEVVSEVASPTPEINRETGEVTENVAAYPTMAADQQTARIKHLWTKAHKLTGEGWHRWLRHHYDAESVSDLTPAQADQVIKLLETRSTSELADALRAISVEEKAGGPGDAAAHSEGGSSPPLSTPVATPPSESRILKMVREVQRQLRWDDTKVAELAHKLFGAAADVGHLMPNEQEELLTEMEGLLHSDATPVGKGRRR